MSFSLMSVSFEATQKSKHARVHNEYPSNSNEPGVLLCIYT